MMCPPIPKIYISIILYVRLKWYINSVRPDERVVNSLVLFRGLLFWYSKNCWMHEYRFICVIT